MMTETEHTDLGDVQLILTYAGEVTFERTQWEKRSNRHWVLDLITQGSQQQRVAQEPSFMRGPGLLALYAPSITYVERTVAGQVISEAYMVFSASGTTDRMLHEMTGARGYCHIEDVCETVADLLKSINECHHVGGPGTPWRTTGLIFQVLGLLCSATEVKPALRRITSQSDVNRSLLSRVADYLHVNLGRPISVTDLADAMNMSQSAFAHTYRLLAGETPYQAILRSKMNAAKRLLVQDGLNVQQTAKRLGFNNAFNFSRAFKRTVGCAPSQYFLKQTGRTGRES